MIQRRDPHLNEALEVLNERFLQAGGNPIAAYELLLPYELEFIDNELAKCRYDFKYYCENFHTIQSKEQGGVIKMLYPFWESQEIFLEALAKAERESQSVRLLVLKARQLGVSSISAARIFHWTIFYQARTSLVVAHDVEQADYLFSMSRFAHANLPWWMRPEVRYDAKGRHLVFDRKDDALRSTNPGLNSSILVAAANQPGGVAVGKGLNTCHGSELSSWKDGAVLAEQLLPALEGEGSKGIWESTARGRGNVFHRLWKAAEEGTIPWTPLFIPAYKLKSYSIPIKSEEKFELTDEEKKTKENVLAEMGDIVPDEHFKWRRVKESEAARLTSAESIDQEYALTASSSFTATGLSPFNKKKLMTMLRTTVRRPIAYGEIELTKNSVTREWEAPAVVTLTKVRDSKEQIPPQREYGSRLYVWEIPDRSRDYYIGSDVALGNPGGAFSCAQVFKIGRTGEDDIQVAEWHGWMDVEPFARVLAALGHWYNECEVSVEMNNECGGTCHTHLTHMLQYPNWFRWEKRDQTIVAKTNYIGWVTNSKTRGSLFSKFGLGINEGWLVLRSKDLVDQCLNISRSDGSDRYEDKEGTGDRFMAAAIAIWCAHSSDWAREAAAKPATTEKYACVECGLEYKQEDVRIEGRVRLCPKGHKVTLSVRDVQGRVQFPGDEIEQSMVGHLPGTDGVPGDVAMWEDGTIGSNGEGLYEGNIPE